MRPLDFALLFMILIWGSNFAVVKVALRDFPEGPFNAMRLASADMQALERRQGEKR